MTGINEIKRNNNNAIERHQAETSTSFYELPTGQVTIAVLDQNGVPVNRLLDKSTGQKFLTELGNHDGVKPLWQHRQAVCRKYACKREKVAA